MFDLIDGKTEGLCDFNSLLYIGLFCLRGNVAK